MDDQPVANEVSGFRVLGMVEENVPFWRTSSPRKFGDQVANRRLVAKQSNEKPSSELRNNRASCNALRPIAFELKYLTDLERSRLARIFIKITTHLNLQDMFRSCNDHLQLKVELI